MQIKFFIPVLPKLPNQLLGSKWFVRASHSLKWKKLVGEVLIPYMPIKTFDFAEICFTRCSSRTPDFDGLVGSFKPVLDALVHHGLLQDDSMNDVRCEYVWEKSTRKEQGVRIEFKGTFK